MPTPSYQINITPRGTYDFSVTLTQAGLPAEIFEADKTGMMQDIPSLANRARFSDFEPIVIATLVGAVVTASGVWTNVDLTGGITVNQNNWFNGIIFQPNVAGYYRFKIKMTAEALDPEGSAYIRLLLNGVSQIASNPFTNFFAATPINIDLYLNQLALMNGTTDFIQFQVNTDINTAVISSAFNYLEITRI